MPPPPPAEGGDAADGHAVLADDALLRRWALPAVEGAKATRGTCLVIGGSAVTPGAVVLAAVGALRSGAGKVRVATVDAAAAALAVAVPEALVVGLQQDDQGDIIPEAVDEVLASVDSATSVLVGPGLLDPAPARLLLTRVAERVGDGILVVDANALPCLADDPGIVRRLQGRVVVTPNVTEVGELTGREGDVGDDDLEGLAVELSERLGAVVAAKGADTWVAAADGRLWRVPGGGAGLSTAGSGDVLAGVIAGLAARADEPAQAAVHGVHAHAEAGRRLARRIGSVGFLARELLDEIPGALDELTP